MQEGQFIKHIGEPLALVFPVDVHTPQHVAKGFRTHRHLRGQRLFGKILEGTAHLQVFREIVFPVES